MNKCLVTTLKGVVNDNNLRKLGEFRFTKRAGIAATADSCFVSVSSIEDSTVEILNDGQFCQSGSGIPDTAAGKIKTFPAGSTYSFWVTPGSIVSIRSKYTITRLAHAYADFDLSELNYMTELKELICQFSGGLTGDIAELTKLSKLNYLALPQATKLTGNISALSSMTNLTYIALNYSRLSGDIASLGTLTNLDTLSLGDSVITGNIEDLVSAQISAGRTSGTIALPYIKATKLFYEGQPVATNPNVPANSSNNAISWTSDGTITWIG